MYLPGVGSKRAETLKQELKIVSFYDLIYYFPYRYEDRSKIFSISEITPNMPYVQIIGRFVSLSFIGEGRSKRLSAKFSDSTGIIELVWFKGHKYIHENIKPDTDYLIFGKPNAFNNQLNIVHPETEKLSDVTIQQRSPLLPYYNTTEKMKSQFLNSKAIFKLQQNAFSVHQGKIPETLPPYFIEQYKLMFLNEALFNIHFPKDHKQLQLAQNRLKFEELFYIQLSILKLKSQRNSFKGLLFPLVGEFTNSFYKTRLPFELTQAQKRVIKEIRRDMGSGKQMNRLLQGDVGSGKTIVALMIMLIACDNFFQATIMAPTEILAQQHFESINQMAKPLGVNVGLLTGSTKKSDREILHNKLETGELQILIGTHALIENQVKYHNLGLVIIDEQHRFGVAQRAKLWKKNSTPPHVLVMTATPIPRTLALTIYGDLDVSVIDELPPGRKPIETVHYYHNQRNNLNHFIKQEIQKGRQIYIVYPLIDESDKVDFKNLTEGFEYMQRVFPDYKIEMIHGRLKPSEKDVAMKTFTSGFAQILVSTTLIEVGVNVPNASVMIIESAERFGLSQLHQLRGRVGRGAEQSYCVLMTSPKLSDDTRKRMEIMTRTNDGFEIAEADLKLRGPGDLEGTQQSGLPFELKIANLAKDQQILQLARQAATKILDEDPLLELSKNFVLNKQLTFLARQKINWSMIS